MCLAVPAQIKSINNFEATVGALEPFRIYLTCVEVLRAAQDRRAEELLAKAHVLLHRQAAQIPDLELRRTFLESEQATAIHEEDFE